MRGIHNHHPKIENTGNGLNTIMGVLIIVVCFGAIFKNGNPNSKPSHAQERISAISDDVYLLAVMTGGTEAKHSVRLSNEELEALDRQASLQTRDEDVAQLKPKARARYYATLNRSVWEAVE